MIQQLAVAVPTKEADRSWFIGKKREDFDRATGIRHTWRWDGTSSELALHAARALTIPKDLSAVIVVTQSPDHSCPSMAYDLVAELGLPKDIPVFDVNQACAGFIYGLLLADRFTYCGQCPVLLVTVDRLRMEAYEPETNKFIFSDAASACVVDGPFDIEFRNEPEGRTKLVSSRQGFMRMEGGAVFDYVSKNVPKLIRDFHALREPCDFLVQHQSNQALMDLLVLRSGFAGKTIDVIEKYGNCSMTSIPVAIADQEEKLLGKRLLLCGYGAGWSTAMCSVWWPPTPICKVVRP